MLQNSHFSIPTVVRTIFERKMVISLLMKLEQEGAGVKYDMNDLDWFVD